MESLTGALRLPSGEPAAARGRIDADTRATGDHPAYAAAADWLDGVFHLPEPDREPVPAPARCALVWRGRRWAEFDPATRRVLGRGVAG